MTPREPSWAIGLLALQAVGVGAYLAGTGQWIPVEFPDTPSYANYPFTTFIEAFSYFRTPGYPLFLQFCQRFGANYRAVPWITYLIWVIAVVTFWRGLRTILSDPLARLLAASTLFYANTLLGYLPMLGTDTLAAALGIACVGTTLIWSQREPKPTLSFTFVISLLVSLSWLVRPAYVFLVPLTPLVGALVLRRQGEGMGARARRRVVVLVFATFLPLLAYSGIRHAYVGEFGVVSFGGYNLIGLVGQFIDGQPTPWLTPAQQELVDAADANRRRPNERYQTYSQLDRRNYARIENLYDVTIWTVYAPAARERFGTSDLAVNRGLGELGLTIVRHCPVDYVVWLVKATRQAVRKVVGDLAANPVYLAIIGVLVGSQVLWTIRFSGSDIPSHDGSGERLLFVIVVTYLTFNLFLVILVCPPLGRFTDAGAVLAPTILGSLAARKLQQLFSKSSRQDRSP